MRTPWKYTSAPTYTTSPPYPPTPPGLRASPCGGRGGRGGRRGTHQYLYIRRRLHGRCGHHSRCDQLSWLAGLAGLAVHRKLSSEVGGHGCYG
uniref:Uncharacterized protein n=1 Tax=Oryza sativa subsp. japonica TaxID=39947 RepID=Q5VPQ8_ORYSJ|nr:hypothetical protein [Oryza sativa Japonica Group]BAD68567.1 hypothetical protein [Oryza sativa Japonica Group]